MKHLTHAVSRPGLFPTAALGLMGLVVAGALSACGGGSDATTASTSTTADTTTADTTTADTTTATTASSVAGCDYAYSGFNSSASVNNTSTASWSCSTTARALSANGIPDHAVGTFPNADNPNTISAQVVTASLTLTPTLTTTATQLGGPRGVIAYVLNGIKVDAGTNGTCNDSGSNCDLANGGTGSWNVEALGQSSFKFGTDSNNAHVQPDGAYHYHGMPEGFVTQQSKGSTTRMTLIGWAADGFPVYARYGYSVATNASSGVKVMTGSYRLKTTPSTNRAAVSLYPMGAFTQDYEYVAGYGDLDECNGRTGVTPEFPNGTYHYYATDTYPFLQRCVKGSVSTSTTVPPRPGV